MKAYLDGAPLDPGQAAVSLFDPGFLFGQAVFETFRAYGPTPVALQAHLDRLAASAGQVGLPWPHAGSTRAQLARTVASALAGEPPQAQRLVRVGLYPGVGPEAQARLGQTFDAHTWVTCGPAPAAPPPGAPRSVRAVRQPQRRHPLPTAKAQSYLAAWKSLHDARQHGADDAIWTWDGHVTEAPAASVMAWIDGAWWAPEPGTFALDGITRRLVLQALQREGVPVRTDPLAADRLDGAEEIVLLASVREVESVVELDAKPVGSGQVGRWARQAHRLYRDRITPR